MIYMYKRKVTRSGFHEMVEAEKSNLFIRLIPRISFDIHCGFFCGGDGSILKRTRERKVLLRNDFVVSKNIFFYKQ